MKTHLLINHQNFIRDDKWFVARGLEDEETNDRKIGSGSVSHLPLLTQVQL